MGVRVPQAKIAARRLQSKARPTMASIGHSQQGGCGGRFDGKPRAANKWIGNLGA